MSMNMKAKHQKAQLLAKLIALDPTQDLLTTFFYLTDRKAAA